MTLEVLAEVEGKITGITKFGAFVELPEKRVGLVHISQIADSYVTDVTKHLRIGDSVKVRILGITKDGKYDLSIKQVGRSAYEQKPRREREEAVSPISNTFEDKISNFLKQSEEKLTDWKRNLEIKQTGKKKKKW